MSGHSHFATIHRQKDLKDAARGQIFSKMARTITIAAKTGGGGDPDSNYKLRIAIEKARAASMPKENIDRAIAKAAGAGEALEEVLYEGFGPLGILVLVEATTDNRNRTNPEIKSLFEKNGGKMGVPGSVSFNFEPKGLLLLKKENSVDDQILRLIDLGVEDVEEGQDAIEVYTDPKSLSEIQKKLVEKGSEIISSELIRKPKSFQNVPAEKVSEVTAFLQNIENHDDVAQVFTNADF